MITPTFYEKAYHEALNMQASGKEKEAILSYLVSVADSASGPGTATSILLLDEQGLLRHGAAVRLPEDYLRAIDGLRPHPNVGTCARAAATGEIVITPDFYADDKWSELRHLPIALGFKGAWSMPIKNRHKVLGTFGTYYSQKCEPSKTEINGIRLLAAAAATILE